MQEFPRTRPGDIYLLCSDGLSGPGQSGGAADTPVKPNDRPAITPNGLIDAANANGGRDNISVIIVRVGDPPIADLWWQKFLKKPADKK